MVSGVFERLREAGTAGVDVEVQSRQAVRDLHGTADFSEGYRLCGLVAGRARDRKPSATFDGSYLAYLSGGATPTSAIIGGPSCDDGGIPGVRREEWVADHAPSIPLFQRSPRYFGEVGPGAEDFIHLALLAISSDARVSDVRPGKREGWYRARVDLSAIEVGGERGDGDARLLRRQLRRADDLRLNLILDSEARLRQLRYRLKAAGAPDPKRSTVTTKIVFSSIGKATPVPEIQATAIE